MGFGVFGEFFEHAGEGTEKVGTVGCKGCAQRRSEVIEPKNLVAGAQVEVVGENNRDLSGSLVE